MDSICLSVKYFNSVGSSLVAITGAIDAEQWQLVPVIKCTNIPLVIYKTACAFTMGYCVNKGVSVIVCVFLVLCNWTELALLPLAGIVLSLFLKIRCVIKIKSISWKTCFTERNTNVWVVQNVRVNLIQAFSFDHLVWKRRIRIRSCNNLN